MDLRKLQEPLKITDIDFRIQSINKGKYATILAYKDARVDMKRLDNVCTPLNWKREHVNNNANCIVSIWNKEINQWIGKEDTGSESISEAKKGLASDSFKRACFNWGIGRELYDYPIIQILLKDNEVSEYNGKFRASFNLRLREWKWYSEFDKDNNLIRLACKDVNNKVRYNFDNRKTENK